MSSAESLGSHQLNSFAAFLEEKLHTSSETSIVQNPQLKNMAEGKKPQKGGKKLEVNTTFEIPEDIYEEYCTPDESEHGKETKTQRKVHIQKIERRWAREWREYRYVTPKHMNKFALNPPCPRPPLAPGQTPDPTSVKRGEDFPDEWEKKQAKLAKTAKEAVRKFNEDSAAASAEASASKPKKTMPRKLACKPSSSTMPSRPIPQAAPIPQTAKSSAPPAKSLEPVAHASCQRTTGISIASGATSSSLAPPNSSTGPTLLKTKATAGRGTKPSHHKKQVAFQVPSNEDEADDEELAKIIRNRQQRAARAKGSPVPLLLDPKKILDFIDLWHKDPNTPLPELNLTPGQSRMLTAFIAEEKWKFEKARRAKKAQYKKERFLKKNVVKMTTDELLKIQSEIKALSDEFDAYRADW